MKNQNEAQVIPETKENPTKEILMIVGIVLVLIVIIIGIVATKGKALVGLVEVMSQLES